MRATRTARAAILSIFAVLGTGGVCSADIVMYVDSTAPAGGGGDTWEGAYRFLADALVAAVESGGPAELHVAAGTYRPDRTEAFPLGSGDRYATFQLDDGVRVLGGYAGLGGGADADTRDPDLYVTILSGDLADDDLPGFINNAENAHHVVTATGADDTALLDGLTITAGHASGDRDPACFGGATHGVPCETSGDCQGGACVSLDSTGAGLLAITGQPSIVNCRIVDNFALFQGAGMMLKAGSDLTVVDSTFSGNRALDNGGALYLGQSSPVFTRCNFIGNSGGRYAGASCNRDHSNARFVECLFRDNTAAEGGLTGGGAIVNASSSPAFEDCTFIGNRSILGHGGAMYSKLGFFPELGPSRPEIVGCTFDANEAAANGGGVYDEEGSETTIAMSTFTGNTAGLGGAIYTGVGSTTDVEASQFEANEADRGGAIYNDTVATTTLTDCIMESNAAAGMGGGLFSSGTVALTNCTVRLNVAGADGGGLYNTSGELTLSGGAVGQNTANDRNGGGIYNNRTLSADGVTFEGNAAVGSGGAIYTPGGGSTELTFVSDCVFDANLARYGGGIYGAFIVTDSAFTMNEAINRGGGYYGTNNNFEIEASNCTFDYNRAEEGAGMYAGPSFGEPVLIANCQFRGNVATERNGGGVLITNSPLTMIDCTFDDNSCGARGGGVSLGDVIATITGCVITGNDAATNGGGIRVADGSAASINDTIIATNASTTGGGIYLNESAVAMTNCRVMGNTATEWGGALYAAFCDFAMTNCEVNGNVAYDRGAGLHLFRSNPTIVSTTIAQNVAVVMGGGIFNQNEANPTLSNAIVWGNWDSGGGGETSQITNYIDSQTFVDYSCVEGWTGAFGGTGNIGADPRFVHPMGPDNTAGTLDDDLRLAASSPCIDAADNEAVPEGVTTDLLGNPRFADDPDTPNTGQGQTPITDMGAHERLGNTCPADVDGDGTIGFGDVLRILQHWGDASGPADVDGDGVVGFGDVLTVLALWGPCS